MGINGSGLAFHPLYWRFDDAWKYYIPNPGSSPTIYNHWGHLHFFMMGFDTRTVSGDAFHGSQWYKFSVQDVWGPRSSDPNQTDLYRVIGKPKWFYHITEIWRRVFIQPWDLGGGVGVKYDASPTGLNASPNDDVKTMGPFREGMAPPGKSYSPYWMANCRSLPIDYYTSDNHAQNSRQNAVRDQAQAVLGPDFSEERYNLQHTNMVLDERAGGPPSGCPSFSDELYIWPVIEYQQVVQLNWEPLPGSSPDVTDLDLADDTYGDGWDTSLAIPYIDPVSKAYRSPFANTPGEVLPFGTYNELEVTGGKLVPLTARLHYGSPTYTDQRPFDPKLDLPASLFGLPITTWHNPWGDAAQGKIVQQCIGGVILARCCLVLEHRMGGRQRVWVESISYVPTTAFSGSDQGAATS